ncbi:MAG: GTP cyclohydrolase I FolE2 [Nitrosospira sp.]|nr:GTP cyclohydrolase I FolE2 [Nitrosospira sp.]
MNEAVFPIADVQGVLDTRHIAINRAGIRAIRHPIKITDRDGSIQSAVATFDMHVTLPHQFKGVHMSRFVEILNNDDRVISVKSFESMVNDVVERLQAESGGIEMTFPYFIGKTAPVSGINSLLDYEVTFTGEMQKGIYQFVLKVVVPVTSLCPCSKQVSAYGAHNQRSHLSISVWTNSYIWIEELVGVAEDQASSQLYGLLKRSDEKYVTEKAYDNPKFVEDVVRDVAAVLNRDERVNAYVVESENFESIHNHSAYALVERNKLTDL